MVFLMSFTCSDKNPFPNGMPDVEENAFCDPICDEQVEGFNIFFF